MGRSDAADDPRVFDIASTFLAGRPTGQTTIRVSNGLSFVGELSPNGDSRGTITFPNGGVEASEYHGSMVWRAVVTSPNGPFGTRYYLRNSEVLQSFFEADQQGRAPTDAVFDPAIASTCPKMTFDKKKRALCDGKPATGILSVPYRTPNGKAATIIAEFIDGTPTGAGRIDVPGDRSFVGLVNGFSRQEGITRRADGSTERGTYQADKLYDGMITPRNFQLGLIPTTLRKGRQIEPNIDQLQASLSSRGGPQHYTKVKLDRGLCLADLPTLDYQVEPEMPGQCNGGLYSGKATLKLTPLRAGLSAQTVRVSYQNGQVVGEAKISLSGGQSFKGTLANWQPENGQKLRPLGNDNFEVTTYSNGRITDSRTEYRQPSEGKLAARQIFGALLGSVPRCIQGGCGKGAQGSRSAYRPEDAGPPASSATVQTNSRSNQAASNQQYTMCGVYTADGQYVASSDPAQCAGATPSTGRGTYSSQRTGTPPPTERIGTRPSTERDASYTPYSSQRDVPAQPTERSGAPPPTERYGTPQPTERDASYAANTGQRDPGNTPYSGQRDIPAQSAERTGTPPSTERNTPAPAQTYVANFPARQNDSSVQSANTGSQQYAVCNYNTPDGRQLTSTDPTVCATVVRQQQNGEPVSGVPGATPIPSQDSGSRQYAICDYYTPDGQRHTSTDPAVCTAAAREAQNTPRPAATLPVSTPASNPSTASSSYVSTSTPNTPSGGSPGSYSQSSAPNFGSSINLTWPPVPGTAYYDLGVRNLTTNQLTVDTQTYGTSYSTGLPPGPYRWNVRACNQANQCSSFTAPLYFSVGSALTTASPTSPTTNQSTSALGVPTGLYPTNQGDLALPIPLGWNAVPGATRYRLAVHDRTDGTFPVDDQYVLDNPHWVKILKPGHQFAWDVAACNSAVCSERSANGGFRSAAAKILTYAEVMNPREQAIFDEYFGHLARIPEANPPSKFSPDFIKRMQDSGRWQSFMIGIENDNLTFRETELTMSTTDAVDRCGGQNWTKVVPDQIGFTSLRNACRKHDLCYENKISRATCDLYLKNDIITICRYYGSSYPCYLAANVYYISVRSFGDKFYQK